MTKLKIFIPLLIAAILTAFLYLLMHNISGKEIEQGSSPVIKTPDDDSAFGWLFSIPQINDSLPHSVYRQIEDSLNRVIESHQKDNNSEGEVRSIGFLGISKVPSNWGQYMSSLSPFRDSIGSAIIQYGETLYHKQQSTKDSAAYKAIADSIKMNEALLSEHGREKREAYENADSYSYYLTLNGYELDYHTKFFVKNGTFNLAYPMWGNSKTGIPPSVIAGHYEQKRIKVRYAAADKKILIPISESRYRQLNMAVSITGWVLMFLCIFFVAVLPLLILVNIATGKAFIKQNIRLFRYTALFLLVVFLCNVFGPYLIHKYYAHLIPEDFKMKPFLYTLIEAKYDLFKAVGFYIVSLAFKRGYNLQQEQSLTI